MAGIVEALTNVMADVGGVAKRDRNFEQKFSFRGIDSVLNAVGPALRRHRIFIIPEVIERSESDYVSAKGTKGIRTVLRVRYTFTTPGDEPTDPLSRNSVSISVLGEAIDYGDKSVTKAMSVALRTALIQALALPTDEADPDAISHEPSSVATVATDPDTEAAEQTREKILDWANSNSRAPRDVASQFQLTYGEPIQRATLEQLNAFYATLTLGAQEVSDAPAQ